MPDVASPSALSVSRFCALVAASSGLGPRLQSAIGYVRVYVQERLLHWHILAAVLVGCIAGTRVSHVFLSAYWCVGDWCPSPLRCRMSDVGCPPCICALFIIQNLAAGYHACSSR
jgi:hypothetical protein